MKIKYRKSDNVIIAMGACDFAPDAEYEVEEVNADIPSEGIQKYKRVPGGIEKRAKAEVEAEELAEKNGKKAKHAEDLALLGWDKQKLKAVKRLILSDGNDD